MKKVFVWPVFFLITVIILAACGGGGGGSNAPTAPTYGISGAITGATIANVTINLTGAASASVKTDAEGKFSLTGLANGNYTVTPSLAGGFTFTPANRSITVNSANVAAVNFAVTVPDVDSKSSYTLRKTALHVDYNAISANPGFKLAIAYADFNKNGSIDIFLARGDGSPNRTPVQFLMNNGAGIFSDQTATVISNAEPGAVHARKALTGDYNGDGWPDLFLIGHGHDQPPFPGEYPLLFLSNGNGTVRYVSNLESIVGFHHGGASADIDNDGDIDIIVAANTTLPFILINDGQGNFTKNTDRLPAEISLKSFFTAELIDIDKDGYVDLIVGGHEHEAFATTVYWGNKSGSYQATSKTVLPGVSGWGVALDFAAEDIDGDGFRDIIINRTGSTNFYVGRYIQILRRTGNRQFTDETASRITMDTTQAWFPWFRVQDIDGDGRLDIFTDNKGLCTSGECAWRNNGSGVFTPYAGAITPSI